jgi:hypothetical protein
MGMPLPLLPLPLLPLLPLFPPLALAAARVRQSLRSGGAA